MYNVAAVTIVCAITSCLWWGSNDCPPVLSSPPDNPTIYWPPPEEDDIPLPAKEIVVRLLCPDPTDRLGSAAAGGGLFDGVCTPPVQCVGTAYRQSPCMLKTSYC